MNYRKIYNQLIQKRLSIHPSGQIERHHIIPRCKGGDNSKENIVELTPREHFICHYLLAKIYGDSLWSAYYLMANINVKSGKGIKLNSRLYESARKNYISYLKTKTENKNPNFGNKYSKDSCEKISKKRKKYTYSNHPKAITKKTTWAHISGETFFGNHFDLSKGTGLNHNCLRRVSAGKMYSYKGWSCPETGRLNLRSGINTNTADKKIYTWLSPDGRKIEGTRCFVRDFFGLNYNGTSNLVRGVIKKHKGWSVCL